MADEVGAVRISLSADSAKLEADLAKANRSLRGFQVSGQAAGDAIGAAIMRIPAKADSDSD